MHPYSSLVGQLGGEIPRLGGGRGGFFHTFMPDSDPSRPTGIPPRRGLG